MSSVADPNATAEIPPDVAPPGRWFVRLVATTTFLGAFLLFQVQPLIGSVVTPWFGGTPTVWTTAMLFFQAMLVVGYGFVFAVTRKLSPRLRSMLYIIAAAGGAAMLPILPGLHWKPTPETDPMFGVLALLFACVGAPYFLLATTGPATQEWFARAYANRSPYRLYSLSNLGSLLGLLTYPFVVQPLLDLQVQSLMWSAGFTAYAVLVVVCAWTVRRYADVSPTEAAAEPPPIVGKRGKRFGNEPSIPALAAPKSALVEALQWIALSAGGSILLLATTNHLCQDISSFPLLWVAPLVVYLLTFIICFDRPQWYRRVPMALATFVVAPLACIPVNHLLQLESFGPRFVPIALSNLAMLFCGCMLCHGELAARKPEPQRLTFYFLMVAIGGAIGGLLVGIVAPLVYDRYWEWIFAAPALALFAAILVADRWTKTGRLNAMWAKCVFVAVVSCGLYNIARLHLLGIEPYVLSSSRNFYGVVQVSGVFVGDSDELEWASMMSGTTRHGTQIFASGSGVKPRAGNSAASETAKSTSEDPWLKPSRWRTTYYGKESGVGRLLLALQSRRLRNEPMKVGVVGLGIGTLATYARERDFYRFYEINPIVVRYADEFFTYLKESDERKAAHEVVLGDARLVMERESPQGYDVLVLDAFSSDAIPTHLLTTQAFEIYLEHLGSDGVLAVHVSNKYLNLPPIVAAAAEQFDLQGLIVRHQPAKVPPGLIRNPTESMLQQGSRWILLARRGGELVWKNWDAKETETLAKPLGITPWTDQRSNFLEILE